MLMSLVGVTSDSKASGGIVVMIITMILGI